MNKLSIRDLDLKAKRVFVRVDFNVPIGAGEVTDDTRIRETLPTLRFALERGARLILASHLGRPKGKRKPDMSLKPAAERLAELLGRPVEFADDCVGPEAEAKAKALKDGEVLVLENLRFHAEEEANDENFARQLAALCDLYVNDAFGSAHRAHASTAGITRFVSQAAAGLLMEKELSYLGRALENPDRPFVAILGGAKVSDKIEVIQNLMKIVDTLLIGGGMAYTFLKAQGQAVGKSLVEDDKLEAAKEILAAARPGAFLLPLDHVVAEKIAADVPTRVVKVGETPPVGTTVDQFVLTDLLVKVVEAPANWMGLDIGPETIAAFCREISSAKTIVWNGPMGVFEVEPFARGTMAVAEAVASSGATSIVGGGDSIAALHKAGVASKISHVSTGGGASLEFLAGYELPGVAALTDKAG